MPSVPKLTTPSLINLIPLMSPSVLRPCIWWWYVFRLWLPFHHEYLEQRDFKLWATLCTQHCQMRFTHWKHCVLIYACHWNLIIRFRLTIHQQWFRCRLNIKWCEWDSEKIRCEHGELLMITVVLWHGWRVHCYKLFCSIFVPLWLAIAWQTRLMFCANMTNWLI